MSQKKIVLSGIQPSGQLTLGHYICAIQNWVRMQTEHDCLFMLADLHTLTVKQDPRELNNRCLDVLALYIACGINPHQNILFAQSHVPAHTQLAWILNCFTHVGELNRMTQFKDKSQRHAANINNGLFSYPVLMAADILLYSADKVPVGEDQKQHLELTRDLAMRFNHYYGAIFTIPTPYITEQGARLMSLQEPTQKMSKSDKNEHNYIALLDTPDMIRNKVKRAVTDSGNEVRYDVVNKPGVSNLLTIFSSISGKTIEELEQFYRQGGYGPFKNDLAECIIHTLAPIQQRYQQLRHDQTELNTILQQGATAASARADSMIAKVYRALGLVII